MFLFHDGSLAWEAKDFLLSQPRCDEVQLEQETYYGKNSENYGKNSENYGKNSENKKVDEKENKSKGQKKSKGKKDKVKEEL